MNSENIDLLAKTWLDSWAGNSEFDHDTSWLVLADDSPELCFKTILQALTMISDEPDNLLFLTLSAGPLEELMGLHGEDFIDRVESLASTNQKFKRLLGNVWRHGISEDVWTRLCKCRKQMCQPAGLVYDSPAGGKNETDP